MLDLEVFQQAPQQDLATRLAREWADKLEQFNPIDGENPIDVCDWIENNFLIDRPRMPVTGRVLSKGPMRMAEYQKRVLREAMRRDSDGKLIYSTIVWSEPKKSGRQLSLQR